MFVRYTTLVRALILGLLCTLLPAGMSQAAPVELLINGSFEANNGTWPTTWVRASGGYFTDEWQAGANPALWTYAEISPTHFISGGLWRQDTGHTVAQGDIFKVSGWTSVPGFNGGRSMVLKVYYIDGSRVYPPEWELTVATTSQGAWTYGELTFTIPSGHGSLGKALGVEVTNGTGATVAIDDISLTTVDSVQTAPENYISSGLVAHWPFDGDTQDHSGGIFDAIEPGGVQYDIGHVGHAINLSGAGQVVNVFEYDLIGPWTLAVWVKRSGSGSVDWLIKSGDYAIALEQSNGNVGVTKFGVGQFTFNYTCPTGQWVHLTFVGTDTQTALYVNGVMTDTITTVISCPMGSIGEFITGIPAVVDEMAVWNRTLSDSEIQYLHTTGNSGNGFYVPSIKILYGNKRISGYVTMGSNMAAFLPCQYDKLTDIILFSIYPNSDGTLNTTGVNWAYLPALMAHADDYGVKVHISVVQNNGTLSTIVGDATKLDTFTSALTQFCLDYDFDGVDIDWEEPAWNDTLRAQYTSLLVALDPILSQCGLSLTAAVDNWTTEINPGAIGVLDRVHIMTYTDNFPQDDLSDHISGLTQWDTFGFPPEKLIGGVPFYGNYEVAQWGPCYNGIVADYNPPPSSDMIVLPGERISFNGSDTIRAKTSYTITNGYGGIMIWHMACDTLDDATSLLKAIADASTPSLTAHWMLDETSGTSAADATGNGHAGTLTGGVSFSSNSVAGRRGSALDFDGVNDYINCGDMPISNGFSISLWVSPDNIAADWKGFACKWGSGGANTHTFWLGQHSTDGYVRFGVYPDGSELRLDTTSAVLSNGIWTHVVATYDGNFQKLFINGTLHATSAARNATQPENTGIFTIGQVTAGNNFFDGVIDDVHVYDYALSGTEVATLFNGNTPPLFTSNPISEAPAVEDIAYIGTLTDDVSDSDTGDTLTFRKTDGPTWLAVAANGALSGTPADADKGLNNFSVQINDGTAMDTATLNITVRDLYDGQWGYPDFGPFAQQWLNVNCGYCGGADLDGDRNVTITDLLLLSGNNWLNDIPIAAGLTNH